MFRISFKTYDEKCADKIGYKSEAAARKGVAKQAAKGRVRYLYKCPCCPRWHLTKYSPAEYADRKAMVNIQLAPLVRAFGVLKNVLRKDAECPTPPSATPAKPMDGHT